MRPKHPSKVALTAVAALLLYSGDAGAQGTPPNLTGTWRFTVTTDAGTGTPTVTLKQQGDSLSGSYSSQVFGEQQVRGSVKDREFNFHFNATVEGNSFTVTYRGTIASADSLQGQITLGDLGSGTFTAKRQPPGDAPVPRSIELAASRPPALNRTEHARKEEAKPEGAVPPYNWW